MILLRHVADLVLAAPTLHLLDLIHIMFHEEFEMSDLDNTRTFFGHEINHYRSKEPSTSLKQNIYPKDTSQPRIGRL